ncbi:MAG TPA: VWA domain-containing protein, partial [Deinococcales bacterium]|nr:VWA domain-containing protein [Deinococcales bacterium]
GLEMAYEELQGVDAAATHVIVMTDGLSQPADFEGLLKKMTADGITVSAVAIGDGADESVVERLARWGGGTSHATHDFRALPSILSQESLMLSGLPIDENTVQPVWTDRTAEAVQGLPEEVPPVDGFVLTTPKDDATIHLQVPGEDGEDYPLLASWRYGNGHVLAFTSEGVGSWTENWLRDPSWPVFWSQAIRTFLPAKPSEGLNVSFSRTGGTLLVTAELLDEFEETVTGSTVLVNGHAAAELGRGLYRAELPLPESGDLAVTAEADGFRTERSYHVSYPPAFDFSSADPEALTLLAEQSGGRVLEGGEPLFSGGQRYWQPWSVWPLLAVLGLLVFLFELLNRYDPLLFRKERRA